MSTVVYSKNRKTYHKWRSCQSKVKYPTEKDVKTAVKTLWKRFRNKRYPYKCDFCGMYHLTGRRQDD